MGKKKGQALLWLIEPKEGGPVSYLLGTMHTRDGRVHRLVPRLAPFIQSCSVFLSEFALPEEPIDPAIFAVGEDWQAGLSEKKRRKLSRTMVKFGLGPLEAYRDRSPILVHQVIAETFLGQEAALPLDMALSQLARQSNRSLGGVETLEEQMTLLTTIPLDDQVEQLLDSLKNLKKLRKRLQKQVRWYLRQDLQMLYTSSRKQLGSLRKPLLFKRNKRMARRIAEYCREDSHFVAIGAAHLPGGKGVLRRLKKEGYRLVPMPLRVG